MTRPLAKDGALHSVAYLSWVRAQPCYFGDSTCGPTRAHHYPPKGRLGLTNDLSTLPVCDVDHRRCHGETVIPAGEPMVKLAPIPEHQQHFAVLVTFWRFWDRAPLAVKRAVMEDIGLRDDSRLWVNY